MIRRHRSAFRATLLCLSSGLAPALVAQADAPGWNTEVPPGPAKHVEMVLEEGTWMNLDLSPDGKTIVFDLLGDIFTMPVDGGEAKPLITGHAMSVQPRYSPDGKRIAFTSDAGGGDNLWIVNADGTEPRQVTKESFRLLNNPAWTPDGAYLVGRKHFTSRRSLGAGEMWMYPVPTGKGGTSSDDTSDDDDGGNDDGSEGKGKGANGKGGGGSSSGIRLTEKRNEQQDAGEPEISPDGRYLYYSEDVSPGGSFEYNRDPNGVIYVIQRLDLVTGEKLTICDGPGGSMRPELSPDGKSLAFVRRVRDKSVLMVRDLDTGRERAVYDGLSKDGQETWSIFGVYPNFAWSPTGDKIVVWAQGRPQSITVATGTATAIPFVATLQVQIRDALRFPQEIGGQELPVRVIRWPQVTPDRKRVFFHALGYIWHRDLPEGRPERLTEDVPFEYYPSLSADGRQLVYTTWDDREGGRLMVYDLELGEKRTLLEKPGHYAAPVFDMEGERVLYQRLGSGSTRGDAFVTRPGIYLYDLLGGFNRFVTRKGSRPRFHPTGRRALLLDRDDGKAALVSVDFNGEDRRVHATSTHAEDFVLSPTGDMIAWEELFHVYLSPMPAVGGKLHIGPKRTDLPVQRLTRDAGEFLAFAADGKTLYHSHAATLRAHDVAAAMQHAGDGLPAAEEYDLGFTVAQDVPESDIALVNARVITMEGFQVIERGYVHVRKNRIVAVGPMTEFVTGAVPVERDLSGKTIMPGIIDVHAHMASGNAGMLPRNNWAYLANLAFGVTCTHDPSHDTKMVFSASELEKTGAILAPRIFSTGTILYGAESDFKAVIDSKEDALSHLRRLKAYGAFSVKSYNQPRRDQRQQVIAAAAELEMMVVPEGGSMLFHNLSMILDGHTTLEHALPVAPVYEDVYQLFSNSKTAYDPTLVVGYGGIWGENYWYQQTDVWKNERLLAFVPRSIVDPRSRRRTKFPDDEWHHVPLAKVAAELFRRGVVTSVSAHGQLQGLCSHWDLWMFQQGGLSNHDALRTATIHPATALGFDAHLGSLRPGKLADLLVLDENPLEDIRQSTSIAFVMKNGRLYDAMTLAELYPRQRKAPELPFLGVTHDLGGNCACHIVR